MIYKLEISSSTSSSSSSSTGHFLEIDHKSILKLVPNIKPFIKWAEEQKYLWKFYYAIENSSLKEYWNFTILFAGSSVVLEVSSSTLRGMNKKLKKKRKWLNNKL